MDAKVHQFLGVDSTLLVHGKLFLVDNSHACTLKEKVIKHNITSCICILFNATSWISYKLQLMKK